jgi:hypothetical protein
MKTVRNSLIVLSLLFTFIFCYGICFAQTTGSIKQENNKKIQNTKVSVKYIRVQSFLKSQKVEWNEEQIQCAELYWQTAEGILKKKLDNEFILLFMEIVNKSDNPQSVQQLADEVIVCCTRMLQKTEYILGDLRPQYQMYKISWQSELERIIEQPWWSSRLSVADRIISKDQFEGARNQYRKVKNQYVAAINQRERYTVYINFAKKVRLALNSAK